jgi:hypothetical protein
VSPSRKQTKEYAVRKSKNPGKFPTRQDKTPRGGLSDKNDDLLPGHEPSAAMKAALEAVSHMPGKKKRAY